jgi:hypothetical protein
MTETAQSIDPTGPPAAGWYADPAGSGGNRWWNGQGWTETVRLTAPPAPPAPPASHLAAPTAPPEPVSQFGGPVVPSRSPAPRSHRGAGPSHQSSSSRSISTGAAIGLGVALLVVAAALVLLVSKLMSGDDPGTPAADTGGPRGPASVASAKSDAHNLAAAEETVYADRQVYLAIPRSSGVVELGQTVVHLSAQNTASVALNPSGTGYCIVVVSKSPTTSASSTAVYVSTLGGLQASLLTTCPASY